jgi:Protein of unknown function (DUF1593)
MKRLFLKIFFLSLTMSHLVLYGQQIQKNRVIVLSDIEADPDDTQTLIRLLLYANDIDIRGLVATTSVHQKTRIAPESMIRVINTYSRVLPNLRKHDAAYPDAEAVLALVKKGQPGYGMKAIGEGKDSEGSDWIIKVLEENDQRPLWVSVWGGANTLAQALYKIKNSKSEQQANQLLQKLRIYTISDQDDSGIWIRKTFPQLFYIVTPGGYGKATWTGINTFVNGINNQTISNTWLAENIQQNHGPLGALYPDVGYGVEGDTPAWLSLVPNGLNVPEHPEWGGWGGRYELYLPNMSDFDVKGFTGGVPVENETRPIWTNTTDTYRPIVYSDYGRSLRTDTVTFHDNKVTLWRWRDDFQNDFAARMDWTFMSYGDANHAPVPALGHADQITIKSGEPFSLDASGTSDPDGDNLSYVWFQYQEVGTLKKPVRIASAENLYKVFLTAPVVDKAGTTHFILKVTDKGRPALSRYKRVIVTFVPK